MPNIRQASWSLCLANLLTQLIVDAKVARCDWGAAVKWPKRCCQRQGAYLSTASTRLSGRRDFARSLDCSYTSPMQWSPTYFLAGLPLRAVGFAWITMISAGLLFATAWSQASVSGSDASANAIVHPTSSREDDSEALKYYVAEVDPGVQAQCLVCHNDGGAAPLGGARLVLGEDAQANHDAFMGFLGPAKTTQTTADANVIAFVERFYVVVLERPSDQAGLDGWVGALTAGTLSGGDVAEAFFLSAEYLNRGTSDDEFVETLYRAFFNRDSDAGGKQGWLAALQEGYSRADVIDGFSGSAEFVALATSYGIRATRLEMSAPEGGDDIDGHWVLAKVVGLEGHGGGTVLTPASPLYRALETYLGLLGQLPATGDPEASFWRGTAAEDREVTLRRASLLLSGSIPEATALAEARQSDGSLRQQVLSLMQGSGFRDFIIRNADDRLLVQGLLNGLNFDIQARGRYPALAELGLKLPEERPEEYENLYEKPFLTSGELDREVTWAITREPLELIAHIITNDLPYSEVLTADYTMVNPFTDLAYRSGSGFDRDLTDERGFFDRADLTTFKPGYNDGYVPRDEYHHSDRNGWVTGFSDYMEVPHAGVLSTQAWLARYPSTDTNRNRARARWTYFHFLGVDIEKSAPRTTDPVALADTNNPTMNNSACTVCHERLDPVAGAYQSFGDLGGYLDQWGGLDSLAESYKHPEWFGGEPGSTLYQEGDTWYRDMRVPGLEGEAASDIGRGLDSLQWLGEQIVADSRFATATVRFWWPAIYGSEPLVLPANTSAPDYQEQLNAFNAQEAEISEIADRFEASGYNARSLFADMIMSRWYRHSVVTDPVAVEKRLTELATVGRGRLLTPEELDVKNRAIFGRTWRQRGDKPGAHDHEFNSALTGRDARFKGFYGGIDGAVVTARNRELTPLMSNLTEAMAIELACQAVVQDFQRPRNERRVFTHLDRNTIPGQLALVEVSLPGKVRDDRAVVTHELSVSALTVAGPTRLRISDMTRRSYESVDGDHRTNADLVIQKIEIRHGNSLIKRIKAAQLPRQPDFKIDRWQDDQGNSGLRGQLEDGIGWVLHENSWVEFSINLTMPGAYEIHLFLGTRLFENNVNDAMLAEIAIVATENIEETATGQAFKAQIADLFLRATHGQPPDSELNAMVSTVTASAAEAAQRSSWFNGDNDHCSTWMLFPDQQTNEQAHQDQYGMMRGWTTLVHAILTSWGYLHD